jgi:hypothetical protein
MKKLLKVFLVLFLAIGIIGCGGKNNLTAKEVYELLIEEGFQYEKSSMELGEQEMIFHELNKENITLSFIEFSSWETTTMTYNDELINGKNYFIDVQGDNLAETDSNNETSESKAQYESLQKFCKDLNISEQQIKDALTYMKDNAKE